MKAILFVLFSIAIVWYSWVPLKNPNRHGFYRFFAFEGLILLFLHNIDGWFVNPFSMMQLFSWVFLFASLGLAIYGFYWLRHIGKPEGSFENTTQLVSTGVYSHIRHPLYASLVYLGIGIFLKAPGVATTAILAAICAFLYATARVEEKENIQHFGQIYVDYMQHTRMFIPWIL